MHLPQVAESANCGILAGFPQTSNAETLPCLRISSDLLTLLDFGGSAGVFQFLLDLFRLFFRDSFFYLAGRAFDHFLGLFQA